MKPIVIGALFIALAIFLFSIWNKNRTNMRINITIGFNQEVSEEVRRLS